MKNIMSKVTKVVLNKKALKVAGIGTVLSAVAGAVVGFMDEKKKEQQTTEITSNKNNDINNEEFIEEDDIIIDDNFEEQ
ncbi:MAG: hypothetical protein N2749_00885 [Clostridia bacterium]|nr:hypothetical protein [Clostridia bacterium]